ncbi:hypothetical protein J5N97_021784 [Dioscorea zingiberensis]|uniref:HMA domain-containing protein n=1 Tax=Dioscorea zingiberensis TaxID=325984 RepID=A0A9D5CA79_9LILI|nr:hypothetical protein J5N97_021784 [Dioscorea zingiberensis]
MGCAKKIQKTILKCRGVEEVEINMVQNQVIIKGTVDPQALCSIIQKKTRRRANVISPLPPAEGDTTNTDTDIVVASQVSGMVTSVELLVNMHCEACAQSLQKKILEMKGVERVETELKSGKVTVTGTMEAEKLIDYVHRRTGKIAKAIAPPPKEEEKKEDDKPPEEEIKKPDEETKKEENTEKKEEESSVGDGKEKKKEGEIEGGNIVNAVVSDQQEDMVKRMMYWNPVYVIERLPPPQMFSDENPNACCIS